MISKCFTKIKGQEVAQVTFSLPAGLWVDTIHLVGTFNNWHRTSHPLRQNRAGEWTITVNLEIGKVYQFRYLCDGQDWVTEFPADDFIRGADGIENFLVMTAPAIDEAVDQKSKTIPTWHPQFSSNPVTL